MSQKVSIVTYHYVRQIDGSRYPGIRGLNIEKFHSQLQYLLKHYTCIRMEDVIESIKTGKDLPSNACLLSFDDGYIDHYENVFPLLSKYGVQGSFYPSAKVVNEHHVLDVNKIHFILSEAPSTEPIVQEILQVVDDVRSVYGLETGEFYKEKFAVRDRFNVGDVSFIKGMLQKELPLDVRKNLLHSLFEKYVSHDEASFSEELYMNRKHLVEMQEGGMHIGSHGFDHFWLSTIPEEQQKKEIDLSLEFLQSIHVPTQDWTFYYPYGDSNASLLKILQERGCSVGLTVNTAIADLQSDNPLLLPRLDTVDIPYSE